MNHHELLGGLLGARLIDLEQERFVGAPTHPVHWPGYVYTLHRHHEPMGAGIRTSASGMLTMAEHSGTHIDALCHQAIEMEMFGEIAVSQANQTSRGFSELGIETVPPIIRRGVLLDVAACKGVPAIDQGSLITSTDLEETALRAGVEIGRGDAVLIRTGWGARFDEAQDYLNAPGLDASAARWLADRSPFLVGADNVAVDLPTHVDPELGLQPCHSILIVQSGIYIVENLNLEELAQAGPAEFLFLAIPLKLRGVTGSPIRPIAVCV